MDVLSGLYLSWKSLIQSSDDEEVREDDEGVADDEDDNDDELIVCFLLQNLGLLSLMLGSLTENLVLFIENPTS